jgi:hypothetical protein
VAIEQLDTDDQALVLRTQSKNFGKIAEALGLARPNDANEAFNRALRRRPADEQVTIRADENKRLDHLAKSVGADQTRTKEEVDERLRSIDRLRRRLMAD